MIFFIVGMIMKTSLQGTKKTTFPYLKNTEEEIGLRPPGRTNDHFSITQIKIVK